MKKLLIMLLLCKSAFGQNVCSNDSLGRLFCAPPGGTAIQTATGDVVCSIGKCVADNLGYLKCSSQQGGGATTDSLGRVLCVGGCVNPSKSLCIEMKGENTK
jgi:hypothetical protein